MPQNVGTQRRATHLLVVDESGDSKEAERLLREMIKVGLHVVHAQAPHADGKPNPQLVAPEGMVLTLENIKQYVRDYRQEYAR